MLLTYLFVCLYSFPHELALRLDLLFRQVFFFLQKAKSANEYFFFY